MRSAAAILASCGTWLLLVLAPGLARAQSPSATFKLDKFQVGFSNYARPDSGLSKAGLWNPVLLTFTESRDGKFRLPLGPAGFTDNRLGLTFTDGEHVQADYTIPLQLKQGLPQTLVSYADFGNTVEPRMTIHVLPGESAGPGQRRISVEAPTLDDTVLSGSGMQLYLTVGNKLPDLYRAIDELFGKADDNETGLRQAAFVTEVEHLPREWFGYQAIDLLILTTSNKNFLDKLAQEPARMKALSEWVQRGGRLVVSVSWRYQGIVHGLLTGKNWQPPLPAVLSRGDKIELRSLASVHNWANALDMPFRLGRNDRVFAAKLNAPKTVQVHIRTEDDEPLLVQIPYGLGSVSLLALEIDQAPFTTWPGRNKFYFALLGELAPRVSSGDHPNPPAFGGLGGASFNDLSAQLHRELDQFAVPRVSFSWVALFILVYILIVGPLDYFLLKKVFKRLEWTWITFPAVVLLISALAYFTAYSLKGRDLQINKIDLVDIDLRTSLTEDYRTDQVHAYGSTWFAILSPHIQNYTVGLQPVFAGVAAAGQGRKANNNVMLTWLGRPQTSGVGSLFRRSYSYADEASGLIDVPIPVWTTRAFQGNWAAPLKQSPFQADLQYQPHDVDEKIFGTLQNSLPVDLEDVYLVYGSKYFRLEQPLRGTQNGGAKLNVDLPWHRSIGMDRWLGLVEQQNGPQVRRDEQVFEPGPILRQLFFAEKVRAGSQQSNQALRPLDQSWRLEDFQGKKDTGVRTAILIGRLPRAQGSAETLTAENDARLPTQLWLGGLPGENWTRPALTGTLIQDTYIRVLIPVRPKA